MERFKDFKLKAFISWLGVNGFFLSKMMILKGVLIEGVLLQVD